MTVTVRVNMADYIAADQPHVFSSLESILCQCLGLVEVSDTLSECHDFIKTGRRDKIFSHPATTKSFLHSQCGGSELSSWSCVSIVT